MSHDLRENEPQFQIISGRYLDSGSKTTWLEYVGPPVAGTAEGAEVEVMIDRIQCLPAEDPDSTGDYTLRLAWPSNTAPALLKMLAALVAEHRTNGPDALSFEIPGGAVWRSIEDGKEKVTVYNSATWSASVVFHPIEGGVGCVIGSSVFRFRAKEVGFLRPPSSAIPPGTAAAYIFVQSTLDELHQVLKTRNQNSGWAIPLLLQEVETGDARSANEFSLHTGQEWTAFLQTATDGKRLRFFVGNEQMGTLRHQRPNASFWTETALTEDERQAGHGIELLEKAATELDLDDGLAWLYISHLLAPPAPLPQHAAALAWIDLDDVARKTMGGYPRNPEEAIERRRKVWYAIRYGARAYIGGRRSVPYFDKTTGREIETEIYTAPWQILQRQQAVQPSLFPDDDEIPVRVELVASRAWTALTTSPDTAQYLPLGEVIGAIPPSQAGGAWARSLGMGYFQWCRCNLQAALRGDAPPGREFLLSQFPSKKSPYDTLLSGPNPKRALEYWCSAEDYLRDAGIIEAPPGERQPAKRKNWQPEWLSASPEWKPGPHLRPMLEALASHMPPDRPRQLRSPRKKAAPRTRKSKSTAE